MFLRQFLRIRRLRRLRARPRRRKPRRMGADLEALLLVLLS